MKKRITIFWLFLLAGVQFTTAKPNFIVLFTDDQGYQDVGCYGALKIKTPHLDQMAAEGMRFSDFYVGSNICSPSRAAILTGRHPARHGMTKVFWPNQNDGLDPSEITIAEVLKEAGYRTAYIGKWHLGHKDRYLPVSQGFDSYFGIPYSNDMYMDSEMAVAEDLVLRNGKTMKDLRSANKKSSKNQVPLMRDTKVVEWPVRQVTLTRRYTEEALKVIAHNEDEPFFVFLSYAMPHVPLFASEEFRGKSAGGLYGDTIEEIDWSVGQILKALKVKNLDQNTLVIFTSDNGPWLSKGKKGGQALPLRGGKFSTYDGGQRVPCIAWRPGTVPAASVFGEVVSSLDFLPTFAAQANAPLPQDRALDGYDITNILQGRDGARSPYVDGFLYHARPPKIGDAAPAIRLGDWKYREGNAPELYNLAKDIGEKNNLVNTHPEKAVELKARLDEMMERIQK